MLFCTFILRDIFARLRNCPFARMHNTQCYVKLFTGKLNKTRVCIVSDL